MALHCCSNLCIYVHTYVLTHLQELQSKARPGLSALNAAAVVIRTLHVFSSEIEKSFECKWLNTVLH